MDLGFFGFEEARDVLVFGDEEREVGGGFKLVELDAEVGVLEIDKFGDEGLEKK